MLNKLLSLHYKVLIQATLSEVIENACRRPRYEYIVSKCSWWSPMAVDGRNFRDFHIYGPSRKGEDRREMYASLPARDEGTDGEKGVDIDSALKSREDMYPDENTAARLFNGIPFRDIPLCDVKASKNNTIISVSNSQGDVKLYRSCGQEGFKNARKGTNIAAQATAISLSTKALQHGYKMVRVRVQGLGPGRMSAIKGLQMGGLDIISVTDKTPVSWNPPRPRKRRKL